MATEIVKPTTPLSRTAPRSEAKDNSVRRVYTTQRIEADGKIYEAKQWVDFPVKHIADALKAGAIKEDEKANPDTIVHPPAGPVVLSPAEQEAADRLEQEEARRREEASRVPVRTAPADSDPKAPPAGVGSL